MLRDSVGLLLLGVGLGAALAVARPAVARKLRARLTASALAGDGGVEEYNGPVWLPPYANPPTRRLRLAHLPTPLHHWPVPRVAEGTEVWIKRDDCTGCELSGNKIRKLEFLLAEAVAGGADSVITVGGIQSNHCRATAAAARRVGLEPHIILRSAAPKEDPGLCGNLMIDRMVGAEMHLVGEGEFNEKGGWGLVCELRDSLIAEGRKPYCFPSGGSNGVGTWGYVETIAELKRQAESAGVHFDRIYFACGSGGTGAGLALGVAWSGLSAGGTELVGLGVDDDPDFFYDKLDTIYSEMGLPAAEVSSRSLLRLEQCIGDGYAKSTPEELEYLVEVSRATGVVLDPVYSGKAALGMVADLAARPVERACFIHTGGLLGLYAQEAALGELVGPWQIDRKVSNASPGQKPAEVNALDAPATSSPRSSSSKPIKPPSRPGSAEIDARLAAIERSVARQEGVEAALLQTQKQQAELQATMTELLAQLKNK